MALHCTVLRARELFVLSMRTLAIQYPDPWGKSAIPNKENSPPCPGWGEVGANIDRCISVMSAWAHWVWSLGVVTGWWIYLSWHRVSGCDECMGALDVVTGCGHWVVDLLNYIIMQYSTAIITALFGSIIPNFQLNFL